MEADAIGMNMLMELAQRILRGSLPRRISPSAFGRLHQIREPFRIPEAYDIDRRLAGIDELRDTSWLF
jgi:hypothetical protein